MRDVPIQQWFKWLGEGGCYFFCVWKLVDRLDNGRYHDPLLLYDRAVYNKWMREDGWMIRPERILETEVGGKWEVRHEPPSYSVTQGEYEVLRYERKTPEGAFAHFVLPDWDPLGDSITRREGVVASKRVFRRVA